jgi:hypothetical protein
MRVLFWVEPVILRRNPALLRDHVNWFIEFVASNAATGARFALAANDAVCGCARQLAQARGLELALFELDAWAPLRPFNWDRVAYLQALYGSGDGPQPLLDALAAARRDFAPDVVLASTHSVYAQRAFEGVRVVHMELAPLPRVGHPVRLYLDPCGHQVGSLLERHAQALLDLALPAGVREAMSTLLAECAGFALRADARGVEAVAALERLRGGDRVALLALQVPDWVTQEGALGAVEPEALLLRWAEALPPGWVGVPAYHPLWSLSPRMERQLARACPRLRFLPQPLSLGHTEALLTAAQGLVTTSSSTAMTALLWQRQVVVAGRSPYAGWCPHDAAQLDVMRPLAPDQASSLLAFLCHRYVHRADRLLAAPGEFMAWMWQFACGADPVPWMMDLSRFDLGRARSLFATGEPAQPAVQAQ